MNKIRTLPQTKTFALVTIVMLQTAFGEPVPKEALQVISLFAFESANQSAPTQHDLVLLKQFMASESNREEPNPVTSEDISRQGYTYRLAVRNVELDSNARQICNQGITWSDTRGMAVKADIKPVAGGEYDFTVNFRRGKDPIVAENAKTIRLTEPNSGIVVFENGLVVLWQTKSKKK